MPPRSLPLAALLLATATACGPREDLPNSQQHCWWAAGDATCQALYPDTLPYCSSPDPPCHAKNNHGCVADPPEDPACHSPCGGGQSAAECEGIADATGGTAEAGSASGDGGNTNGSQASADGETDDGGPIACVDTEDCPAGGNCIDELCVFVSTCLELVGQSSASGVYELDPDDGTPPYQAYCDLETDGGGWTLVLKAEGDSPTFRFDASHWTQDTTLATEYPDLDRHEAKLASWSKVPFTQVMIGLDDSKGVEIQDLRTLTFDIGWTESLYHMMRPDLHVPTQAGRQAWLDLIDDASLQPACNKEGFNVRHAVTPEHTDDQDPHNNIRIGIIANNGVGCDAANSRLGIGGEGGGFDQSYICYTVGTATGNFAACNPTALNQTENREISAFGAVFVR